jgi:hypothetical protein
MLKNKKIHRQRRQAIYITINFIENESNARSFKILWTEWPNIKRWPVPINVSFKILNVCSLSEENVQHIQKDDYYHYMNI